MFRAGGHVGFLHALDVGHTLRGGQDRILAHVFEIASAQRTAFDVDGRAENHVLASASGFLPQYFTGHAGQVGVPCGGDRRAGRQVGHIVTGVVQRRPIVVMQFGVHAHRTIIHPERRNAQSFGVAVAEQACGVHNGDFLVQRELRRQFPGFGFVGFSNYGHAFFFRFIAIRRCGDSSSNALLTKAWRKVDMEKAEKFRQARRRRRRPSEYAEPEELRGVGPVRRVRRPLLVM